MPELKPCPNPWCSSDPKVVLSQFHMQVGKAVRCQACGLIGPQGDTDETSIAAWNQRNAPDALSAAAQQMERALIAVVSDEHAGEYEMEYDGQMERLCLSCSFNERLDRPHDITCVYAAGRAALAAYEEAKK